MTAARHDDDTYKNLLLVILYPYARRHWLHDKTQQIKSWHYRATTRNQHSRKDSNERK